MSNEKVLTFDEMYEVMCAKSYDELRAIMNNNINSLLPLFRALDPENGGKKAFWSFIFVMCGTDGKISSTELDLICGALDPEWKQGSTQFEESKLEAETQKEGEKVVDRIFDSSDVNTKSHLLTLCVCLAAADKKVTAKEKAFVKRLLA